MLARHTLAVSSLPMLYYLAHDDVMLQPLMMLQPHTGGDGRARAVAGRLEAHAARRTIGQ